LDFYHRFDGATIHFDFALHLHCAIDAGGTFRHHHVRENEIRLMKLFPAKEKPGNIACELETAILYPGIDDPNFPHDRGCKFVAWMQQSCFTIVTCDGCEFDL
jgi:hypothetical protein